MPINCFTCTTNMSKGKNIKGRSKGKPKVSIKERKLRKKEKSKAKSPMGWRDK